MADDTALNKLRRYATTLLKKNVPAGMGGGETAEQANSDNRRMWLDAAAEGQTDLSYKDWIREKEKEKK